MKNKYTATGISKFLSTTLIAAAAMTAPAFAEGTVSINGTEYDSFDAAFNAASEGDSLVISGSVTVGSVVAGDINKDVELKGSGTIDLAGNNFIIGYKTDDAVVTITEGSDISFINGGGQGVVVSGARESDRFNGTFIIDNAYVSMDYLLNRNITTIKGDGNGIISEKANLSLTKGVIIGNRKAETGGSGEGILTLTDNAYVKISDNTGHVTEIGYEGGDGHLVVEKNSTFDNGAGRAFVVYVGDVSVTTGSTLIAHSIELKSNTGLLVSDSTLTASSLTNNGTISVLGESTVKFNTLTGTGDPVTLGGADERSAITLGSAAEGQAAQISVPRLNIYKSDLTLTGDVSVSAPTSTLHKIQDSTVDMGGHTFWYKGFTVLDSYAGTSNLGSNQGVVLKNGMFKVTDSSHLCFQGYDHVISEDAVVDFDGTMLNSSMVNVYGSLTINGTLKVAHGNYGYDNVGTKDSGWSKSNYPVSVLTISGENASYTVTGGHMFRVWHETESTGAGTMIVEKGATFSFTGERAGTGLFYNSNIVKVDATSKFVVDTYYGYGEGAQAKKGAFNSEIAGEMVILGKNVTVNKELVTDRLVLEVNSELVSGSVSVSDIEVREGSVLTASVITGTGDVVLAGTINVGESLTTGNLTIVAGATLNIGPMVALFSANSEENKLSFDTLTIVDEEGTLINDNGDLDLSSILSEESTGTSALLSAIKSKASESESPVVKVQDEKGSVFDVEFTVGENGEISATVVPEPSAFGLLAGLGAIALAVSRRRRR